MLRILVLITGIGSALVAGVCFAFSAFVMRGLHAAGPVRAIEAMQAINRFAVRPAFMAAFMGTALAALALAAVVLVRGAPGAGWLLAGCALYLVGMVGVTAAGNVPLNDTLATVDPHAAGAAARWAEFADPWTLLNHVRTLAGVAAAAVLAVGATS